MKKWKYPIILALLTAMCGVGYSLVGGPKVLADGSLQEPFAFIPLAWTLAVASIISALHVLVKEGRGERHGKNIEG